jgi:hypothetical protein
VHPRLIPQPFPRSLQVPERGPRVSGAARHLTRAHVGGRGPAVRRRLIELLRSLVEEAGGRLEILACSTHGRGLYGRRPPA